MSHRAHAGFTLIELLIAITILGILAAWGLPTYFNYVEQSKRTDATTSLTKILAQQELYFANNLTYTDDVADIGYAAQGGDDTTESLNEHYAVTFGACGTAPLSACVQITATAKPDGDQRDDAACQTFVADSRGKRESQDANGDASDCWD